MNAGKFVSYNYGTDTITLSHVDAKDSHHAVSKKVRVEINGKWSSVTDLRPGDSVQLDGVPAVLVTASR